jgi:hypothetical protein
VRRAELSIMISRATCFVLAAALGAAAPAACNSSNDSVGGGGAGGSEPAQATCDPLAPAPITLGKIIGVGKDASGTLYVDAEKGIFVSSGDTLIRQHVTGTGESGSTEFLFSFEAPDGSGAQNLLVETDGNTATKMALAPDGTKGFLDESPSGITMLTVVPPSTVAGMKLANTSNAIQWFGDVANGDVIMATAPVNPDPGAAHGGLALFYGPKSAVAQRQIVDFQQASSGGGSITFLASGVRYTLALGVEFGGDGGPFGELVLQGLTPEGGVEMNTFIRKPTPTSLPEGFSFTCLP